MKQEKFITKSRKGKHLTYEERIKLEALYKLGGRSERTIRREIARGTVKLMNSDLT